MSIQRDMKARMSPSSRGWQPAVSLLFQRMMRESIARCIMLWMDPTKDTMMLKVCAMLLIPLLLLGCSAWNVAALEPQEVRRLAKLPYPAHVPLGEDLDILVLVDGRKMQLVNRTPRSYRQVQLWLNQQYVGQVGGIAIGTKNYVNLQHFVNRYQELYPAGSFLHPERAFPVVQAEILDPAGPTRHRLIARQAGL